MSGLRGALRLPVKHTSKLKRGLSLAEWPACFVLALIPFLYLVSLVIQYSVDVPFWDQWDGLIPLLEKSYQGTLSFRDLWTQHNEHRLVFPRIVMLILARISGWNTTYELAVGLALAVGILLAFIHQVEVTGRSIGNRDTRWLIPVASAIVFSLGQYENWLWGWQFQVFMNVLAVVIGIILLAHPVFKWTRFLAALLMGVVATYSFANGLLYWPIGLLTLLVVRRDRKIGVALWVVVGLLVFSSYAYSFWKPVGTPSLWTVLEQPSEYANYAFCYLGAPLVTPNEEHALIVGLSGPITLGCTIWLLRRRRYRFQVLIPYISLGLYSIGSALMTGIGRAGWGCVQALNSRYVTISSLLWLSNSFLIHLVAGNGRLENGSFVENRLERRRALSNLVAVALLVVGSSFHSREHFVAKREYLLPARDALLTVDSSPGNDDLLARLFPRTDLVREWSDVLRRHKLSVFRDRDASS